MVKKEIETEDVKALLKFIVAGYFCDILNKKDEESINLNISFKDKEVLQLVADGLSEEEIAKKLVMSKTTVSTTIDEIFAKLENQDRTQFARFALKNGAYSL